MTRTEIPAGSASCSSLHHEAALQQYRSASLSHPQFHLYPVSWRNHSHVRTEPQTITVGASRSPTLVAQQLFAHTSSHFVRVVCVPRSHLNLDLTAPSHTTQRFKSVLI